MNKYLDANGLLYVWEKIKSQLSGKVDKAAGKGLSANDFTDEEKAKLAGLSGYVLPAATEETLGGVKVGPGLAITGGVLSARTAAWDEITGKPELALKSDITGLYRFKGSVASAGDLPEADNILGDVWNVEATGMNYAWDGERWDALGGTFALESITNEEIDGLLAV